MQKKARAPKKAPAPQYRIAEWFGQDIRTLTPESRQSLGRFSFAQAFDVEKMTAADRDQFWLKEFGSSYVDGALSPRVCPSLSNLVPRSLCNKSGGVCSMRR
jgi:hypothetical protein